MSWTLKKSSFLLLVVVASVSNQLLAQAAFEPHVLETSLGQMPYRLLLPDNYDADKKYPLVLFLHGAGERGKDNHSQLEHGSAVFLDPENRKKHPAIVAFPQCPKTAYWATVIDRNGPDKFVYSKRPRSNPMQKQLKKLLKKLRRTYAVDPERIYVGGLSMGGMGTFELVYQRKKTFAAAFAICGGAHPSIARKIWRPVWRIDHGRADKVVPLACSTKMADALKKAGAKVHYRTYDGVGHNSWDNVFADSSFLPWLFAQRKKP